MPTGDIVCLQRSLIAFSAEDALVSDYAITWFRQIGMCVETGIKKRDRHAAAGESFISIHAQRRRQHEIILLKNSRMRLDLAFRAAKQLETASTNLIGIRRGSIRDDD